MKQNPRQLSQALSAEAHGQGSLTSHSSTVNPSQLQNDIKWQTNLWQHVIVVLSYNKESWVYDGNRVWRGGCSCLANRVTLDRQRHEPWTLLHHSSCDISLRIGLSLGAGNPRASQGKDWDKSSKQKDWANIHLFAAHVVAPKEVEVHEERQEQERGAQDVSQRKLQALSTRQNTKTS